MARYKIINRSTQIHDTETNQYFFANEFDPLYQEFMVWINAGNEPDMPDPFPHEDLDDKIRQRRLVRVLRRMRQWIRQQDPNADIPNL